jgi:hypothetical protein
LILSACGGGGGSPGRLIVESRITDEGQTELIVSVDGRVARQPELATSAPRVGILCTDRRGRTTLAARHPWPFPEEPGFLFAHVHQPASPDQIERTSRCRLTGTKVVIEGEGP